MVGKNTSAQFREWESPLQPKHGPAYFTVKIDQKKRDLYSRVGNW